MFHRRPVRITPARRWQPLADAERDALLPFVLVRGRPGRPIRDARKRLDAVFWLAASGSAWRSIPDRFGSADTVSRHFRRLTHTGLWERLLRALARPDAPPALLSPGALDRLRLPPRRPPPRHGDRRPRPAPRPLLGLEGALPPAAQAGFVRTRRPLAAPRRAAENARDHGLDAAALEFLRFSHRFGCFAAGRKRLGRRFLPA